MQSNSGKETVKKWQSFWLNLTTSPTQSNPVQPNPTTTPLPINKPGKEKLKKT
jgi:hypothetical protein